MPSLTSPPSLLPLYAKAAVTTPLHRGGDSLPDSVYSLADQQIDRSHLAAFQRVCGYRVTDVLPPTYLHVLAFPLSVALMTERSFPFPLVGMVHVANSITLVRPVRADETVSFTVRAADLRPHAAGRQFDLLAEATVDGELVWSGRSTYLRRGKSEGGSSKSPRTELEPQSGTVSVVRAPSDIGRRYGAVSGDRNPIHLHNVTAKAFGFSSAIAHGMWLKARTLAALEGRLPDACTIDVAFKLPVLLPASVAISTEQNGDAWALDVRDVRSGKPHLTGALTPAKKASPAKKAAVAKKPSAKKAPVKRSPAKKAAPAKKAPPKKA
jgi:acyl dehydratase